MRSSASKPFLVVAMALFSLWPVAAADLLVYTEDDPPYAFVGGTGRLEGFAVETVQEILRRLGSPSQVRMLPWARGYREATEKAGVALFTMARTREREALFSWVGPIMDNRWIVVGLKGSPTKVEGLEDLRALGRVAVTNQVAWDQYLTGLGFTNLERTVDTSAAVRMLVAGHVDAYVTKDLGLKPEIVEAGFDPGNFVELCAINTVQLYIALSKGTDPETVARWQAAFAAMVADGSFQRIHQKWFSGRRLPGPPRPPAY